jgi:hypothetical protein
LQPRLIERFGELVDIDIGGHDQGFQPGQPTQLAESGGSDRGAMDVQHFERPQGAQLRQARVADRVAPQRQPLHAAHQADRAELIIRDAGCGQVQPLDTAQPRQQLQQFVVHRPAFQMHEGDPVVPVDPQLGPRLLHPFGGALPHGAGRGVR